MHELYLSLKMFTPGKSTLNNYLPFLDLDSFFSSHDYSIHDSMI